MVEAVGFEPQFTHLPVKTQPIQKQNKVKQILNTTTNYRILTQPRGNINLQNQNMRKTKLCTKRVQHVCNRISPLRRML